VPSRANVPTHITFPEIDRADFFDMVAAKLKIKAGQEGLIEELQRIVDAILHGAT